MRGEIILSRLIKGLICIGTSLFILSACSSNKIVGTWIPVSNNNYDCQYNDTELTFTKDGEVQLLDLDNNMTIAGKYKESGDNVYTFNLNSYQITGTLQEVENETTLKVLGGGDGTEQCTMKKKNN